MASNALASSQTRGVISAANVHPKVCHASILPSKGYLDVGYGGWHRERSCSVFGQPFDCVVKQLLSRVVDFGASNRFSAR